MFEIALCDNDIGDMEYLKKQLELYFQKNPQHEYRLYAFSASTELLESLKDDSYDLYILDIIMPQVDGIQLGKTIREKSPEVPVIYTTSSREYAFQAFGIHALDYLEKPVNQDALARAMDIAFLAPKAFLKQPFCIRAKEGLVSAYIQDVMYVENLSRSAVYTLQDNKQVIGICNRTAFEKSVAPISGHPDFVQPHKSYFVNMRYINMLKSDEILMDNQITIPISRDRAAITKKTYMEFISGQRGV